MTLLQGHSIQKTDRNPPKSPLAYLANLRPQNLPTVRLSRVFLELVSSSSSGFWSYQAHPAAPHHRAGISNIIPYPSPTLPKVKLLTIYYKLHWKNPGGTAHTNDSNSCWHFFVTDKTTCSLPTASPLSTRRYGQCASVGNAPGNLPTDFQPFGSKALVQTSHSKVIRTSPYLTTILENNTCIISMVKGWAIHCPTFQVAKMNGGHHCVPSFSETETLENSHLADWEILGPGSR